MIKNIKKVLCHITFFIAISMGIPKMASASEITINATNFPDTIFMEYVTNEFDKDNSRGLSDNEIAEIREISVNNKEIKSLKGIEYFTALEKLECCQNQLTSLDISNNTAIEWLDCQNNQLANLDVSNNTALRLFTCGINQLTSLDVSNNTALKIFDCGINQLTSLDVSNNTVLTNLNLSDNQLTSLDISNNTALTSLGCINNHLTNLDVSNNIFLEQLHCGNNQLKNLDVSNNTDLINIHCFDNKLEGLDLSNNINLEILNCSNNNLTELNINNNNVLTILSCSGNKITELDVNNNTALETLQCYNNQLKSLDVSNNTALIELWCCNNQLEELKLNSKTYNTLPLYKEFLHDYNASLYDLQNITETTIDNNYYMSLLKIIDITKPATYKVNGKDFTIIYIDKENSPLLVPPATHIFSDYNYNNTLSGSAIVVYGNGANLMVNDKKVNNKIFTVYTDILASYKYTINNKGIVKPSIGKVIVGITKSNIKPEINNKNKITDTSASKIARATIKNGQIKITALGKEGGLVYLWVIDTGNKGICECYPVDVRLAPRKLEVQDILGNKIKNTRLENGKNLDICVTGIVSGQTKTDDCTYTATVDPKYQNYITVTPVTGSKNKFTINATGLNNDKDTKAVIIFKCDQNGKTVKFSLTVTK